MASETLRIMVIIVYLLNNLINNLCLSCKTSEICSLTIIGHVTCIVYLVRPDWPDYGLLPACPSCPRSYRLPVMKGSPERKTSGLGWKCESSLKGRIEVLQSRKENMVRITGGHKGKRYLFWLNRSWRAMKLQCFNSKVIKLLKCTMEITHPRHLSHPCSASEAGHEIKSFPLIFLWRHLAMVNSTATSNYCLSHANFHRGMSHVVT